MTHTSSVCRLEDSTYVHSQEREGEKKRSTEPPPKDKEQGGRRYHRLCDTCKAKKSGLSESHAEDEDYLLYKSELSFHWLNLLPFLHLLSSAAAAS